MPKRLKRNLLIAIALVLVIVIAGFLTLKIFKKNKQSPPESQVAGVEEELPGMAADLSGDGNLETVELSFDETGFQVTSIDAYNSLGEMTGSTPKGITFPQPVVDSSRIFRLDSEQNKDFFSFDFIAGPHQFERMFFELYEDTILPVCFKKK